MSTGYSAERAKPHDDATIVIKAAFRNLGYRVEDVPLDGHRPDLRIWPGGHYVDVKTGEPNLTIELDSLNEYRRIEVMERQRVYVVHFQQKGVWVHTPDSITAGIRSGPRPRSGTGSLDDWYLVVNQGTPFGDFFRRNDQQLSLIEGGTS